MKEKRRWGPPGWPWELELLALVFVVTAIAVPYYLQYLQTPQASQLSLLEQAEMARSQNVADWQDLRGLFWALVIVGLYLAHLAMARASIHFMSTPFVHLFSPLVFSMITYYRLFEVGRNASLGSRIVNGEPLELILWIIGVLIITFLVARIRMARLMLNFRDVDWDISTETLMDRSFAAMLLQVRPLIYMPRVHRACERGIVIEGWFYAMPIPFEAIQAIDAVQGSAFLSASYCLATSANAMVRIQVTDHSEPILISPADRNAYLRYCQQRLAANNPARLRDTRAGTTAGGARKA